MEAEQREELRRLADAATPGPWIAVNRAAYWSGDEGDVRDKEGDDILGAEFVEPMNSAETTRGQMFMPDSLYIAAANPTAITALLDELADTEKAYALLFAENARLRAEIEAAHNIKGVTE